MSKRLNNTVAIVVGTGFTPGESMGINRATVASFPMQAAAEATRANAFPARL